MDLQMVLNEQESYIEKTAYTSCSATEHRVHARAAGIPGDCAACRTTLLEQIMAHVLLGEEKNIISRETDSLTATQSSNWRSVANGHGASERDIARRTSLLVGKQLPGSVLCDVNGGRQACTVSSKYATRVGMVSNGRFSVCYFRKPR